MEERLRKFATLVEAGNFTKAAAKLHTSQPALTVAIGKLERELGDQLLVRGARGFQLTPAGEAAYRSAKELQISLDNLKTQLRDIAGRQMSVTIGLIDSLASMLFSSAAESTYNTQQNLKNMTVIVNNSSYLQKAVGHGDIDIAWITGPGIASELLELQSAGIEPMVLVCRTDARLETEKQLNHHLPLQFVSYDRASTTYAIIQASLETRGIAIDPIFYSSSPEIMLELVLQGAGTAVLPFFLVKRLLKCSELTMVRHPDAVIIERPISVITQKRKRLPSSLADVPLLLENQLLQQVQSARHFTK